MNVNTSGLRRLLVMFFVTSSIALAAVVPVTAQFRDEPTAFLYRSTCAELADARAPQEIGELENDTITVRRVWRAIGQGQDRPSGMLGEIDDIDRIGPVQELVDSDFSIVIHERDSSRSAVLACGDIDGTISDNNTLLIELTSVDDSGWAGRALIRPEDRRGNDIEFVVGIYPAGSVDRLPAGTPES